MSLTNQYETGQLGQVEIQEQNILLFANGIPGFEHCQRWQLFHEEKDTPPTVFWLQSLDDSTTMLNVVDPEKLDLSYDITLTPEEYQQIGYGEGHGLAALVILSRSNTETRIRAITEAPLVINLNTQKGLQKTGLAYHQLSQPAETKQPA